ncbi:hypothetical protein FACS1894109_20650 [Spirochaetia bacterium]|nr:hypothetical protein FACS1894109_20650 [Spirochaetia bacterium]
MKKFITKKRIIMLSIIVLFMIVGIAISFAKSKINENKKIMAQLELIC